MKITFKHETRDDDEYRHQASLTIVGADGERIGGASMRNMSDCPEDANLVRDFSWFYSLTGWLKAAYEAGKAGEDLELSVTEVASLWE